MKEIEELYIDISNSINRGNIDSLRKLLLKSNQIDITQDGCDFFYLPIERDQPEIVGILVEYFFQKQLLQYEKNSFGYLILLKELKEHIIDWTEEYGCSEEMMHVLSSYLNLDNQHDLSVITEVSDENSTSAETPTDKTSKTAMHSSESELIFNDTLIPESLSPYNKVMDIFWNNNLLANKNHYTHEFKHAVQDLLRIRQVAEMTDFLEWLKESLSLERVPSKSTLYEWKKQIDFMHEVEVQENSEFAKSLVDLNNLEDLTEKSNQKVESWLTKNALDFSIHEHFLEEDIGVSGHVDEQEINEFQ